MRYHLRTLFILVTLTGIITAVALSILHHRRMVREHRQAFLDIEQEVSLLDSKLHQHILQMPAIGEQLEKMNPIDPATALGQFITGNSLLVSETCKFSRVFHYSWQLPDGSRSEGMNVAVDSVLDQKSLDRHVVRLSFTPSELNNQVAAWIARQFARNPYVEVEFIKLSHDSSVSQEPEAGVGVASEDGPVYSGIR